MVVKTICPYCGKDVNFVDSSKYESNNATCPKCNKPIKKYYDFNCPKCNSSIQVRWGNVRDGIAKCSNCGKKITKPDIPEFRSTPLVQQPKIVEKQVIVEKEVVKTISGEFKQTGVLCLNCKKVTPLGNKRCSACQSKLKVTPSNTVYYNGVKEAIQCQKCGKFTSFQEIKCENCGKKIKL